jgi:hypothetical protein
MVPAESDAGDFDASSSERSSWNGERLHGEMIL